MTENAHLQKIFLMLKHSQVKNLLAQARQVIIDRIQQFKQSKK